MPRSCSKLTFRNNLKLSIVIIVLLLVSLACLSGEPSPASQQVEQAETMVADMSADADQAIADGDYYVAAIGLLSLVGNPGVDSKLNSIAGQVPGGLLYEGTPPFFMPFTSRDSMSLPNWPQTASKLIGITLDGTRGMVNENYNNAKTFFIDFSTGALTPWESDTPYPSPDLKWIVDPYGSQTLAIQNVQTGQQIPLCSPQNNKYRWSRDATILLAVDGNDQLVYLIDVPSGNCRQFNLPGVDWDTDVLLSPDHQQLIIILPGSSLSMEKSQLLVANIDGTGIKKIADLPFYDYDNTALLSPDGNALYAEGYVVSTRTGNFARTLYHAVAWLDEPPPSSSLANLHLIVNPPQGPRGTRFSFSLSGGPSGQEVAWLVTRTTEREQGMAYNISALDGTGSLNDTQGQFGMNTGLSEEAGTYYLLVYIANEKIGMASFTITEP